ncbi:hypothetical protein MJO28_015184 [Puccinia striiformis f. sp. tritici]|uniref:Uncharacterized protein n=1 Tax=Puccinia striiformis f. sp. tritici TaxID=168172 RepID=A0ACC0DTB5_9BASI|nr:hypothetical protein MJO29_014952 [Puccinia striiformis f. sp. tritici]KAI7938264.1 hypothetical protein MJO28_015184 [Puccinia striiformis f. sp. tritici]
MRMKKKKSTPAKQKNEDSQQPAIDSFFTPTNKRTSTSTASASASNKKLKNGDQSESTTNCPVCFEDIHSSSAQLHINNCLDNSPGNLPETKNENSDDEFIAEEEEEEEGSVESLVIEQPTKKASTKKGAAAAVVSPTVPFYKIMPGTTISVDCFNKGSVPGIRSYFLSHAHSDHYTKLSSSWTHGKIYCSKTTANLIKLKLRVHPEYIVPLEFNIPYFIDDVRVVLIDANHCPGSSIFLFEGFSIPEHKPFRYLHCGDFRASPIHLRHPELVSKVIDICYLDTTYLDPKYCFPAQDQVIKACSKAISKRVLEDDVSVTMSAKDLKNHIQVDKSRDLFKNWLHTSSTSKSTTTIDLETTASSLPQNEDHQQPKLANIFMTNKNHPEKSPSNNKTRKSLILVGTYSIGKERIVIELSKQMNNCKIYCADPRKQSILQCIDDRDDEAVIKNLLTLDPLKAHIHIVNLFQINKPGFLQSYLNRFKPTFNHIIAIKPTGWSYKPPTSKIIPINTMSNLSEFISQFQHQQSSKNDDEDDQGGGGLVGNLIFPEKVKPLQNSNFIEIYGVPYSEHSSFFELSCFCISLNWIKIIPTVNCGNPASRAKMKTWIDRWKSERNRLLKHSKSTNPLPQPPGMDLPASVSLTKDISEEEEDDDLILASFVKSPSVSGSGIGSVTCPLPLLIQPRTLDYW